MYKELGDGIYQYIFICCFNEFDINIYNYIIPFNLIVIENFQYSFVDWLYEENEKFANSTLNSK